MAVPQPYTREELDDLVAEAVRGIRQPPGTVARLLFGVALLWSLYQLYIASPLPIVLDFLVINDQQERAIHLAFAIFLAFCAYPAFRSSPRERIPWSDWALAVVAALSALYIFAFYEDVASRAGGARTEVEIVVSVVGVLCLLEATRRAVGMPIVLVACLFIFYAFAGQWVAVVISHRGVSLNQLANHLWLTTHGVFGITLGVSSSIIFLFVLFGVLLDKAGAGNYFVRLAFALLGHLRGGPAKAAVVSSAMTGLISGSAIANIVTTGTFTIPLMKRTGFSAERAAAVETSSSINGQLMPPVMGAAAFLMSEFVNISYVEVIRHAFLPAVIAYIALYYIVHLEAVKANLPTLDKTSKSTIPEKIVAFILAAGAIVVISGIVYFGIGWLKEAFPGVALYIVVLLFLIVYVVLLWIAAHRSAFEADDLGEPSVKVPDVLPILMEGLHFLLPVAVLIWCLMIERFSPALSVSWAISAITFVLVTQHSLIALFQRRGTALAALLVGCLNLIDGLARGARNMVSIGIVMGAAGIIVGVVVLTGLGLFMTAIVEALAGGNVLLMLIFTGIMCMVLGMGLPTTANYIVVVAVMGHTLVTLAAQSGLIVPLIAVHLFVFYFGLLSGTTPPVAVDAFAGAAVARADPFKTCLISFSYDIRTIVLPFFFIFNTDLLLIDIESMWHLVMTVSGAIVAMLVFAAGLKGYLLTKSRLWETATLLLVAFTLLRPGYWIDQLVAPYEAIKPARIIDYAEKESSNGNLRLTVEGENISGEKVGKVVLLPLGPKGASGEERLSKYAGLSVLIEGEKVIVDSVNFNSPAQQWGLDFDWLIQEVQVQVEQPHKQWLYIPAYLLLGLVSAAQLRRRRTRTTRSKSTRY